MQQQEVLQLIETVVRPLREKIELLEKQNQQLRTQIATLHSPHHEQYRLRSNSREEQRRIKREDSKEQKSPSLKKKEEKINHPAWNYGKVNRQENAIYKSPPPVEKNKYKAGTPKSNPRNDSKDKNTKTQTEKPQDKKQSEQNLPSERPKAPPKKIMGGQKFSQPQSASPSQHLKQNSVVHGKPNPESNNSQQVSSQGGSHLQGEYSNQAQN